MPRKQKQKSKIKQKQKQSQSMNVVVHVGEARKRRNAVSQKISQGMPPIYHQPIFQFHQAPAPFNMSDANRALGAHTLHQNIAVQESALKMQHPEKVKEIHERSLKLQETIPESPMKIYTVLGEHSPPSSPISSPLNFETPSTSTPIVSKSPASVRVQAMELASLHREFAASGRAGASVPLNALRRLAAQNGITLGARSTADKIISLLSKKLGS
jgi:hypothetical protein